MTAVERLDDNTGETQPLHDPTPPETSVDAMLTAPASEESRLRPLMGLAPYLAGFRPRAILRLVSPDVTRAAPLVVPVALRRMIDFGFTPKGIAMINSYFSVMVVVVVVLALASASRYYLVMTIGERIVPAI